LIAGTVSVVVLAGCGSSAPLRTDGARISHLTIASRFLHRKMALTLVRPRVAGLTARCPCSCTASSTTTTPNSQTSGSRRCARSARAPAAGLLIGAIAGLCPAIKAHVRAGKTLGPGRASRRIRRL